MREHANNCIDQSRGSDQDNSTDVPLASDIFRDNDGPIGKPINCVFDIAGAMIQVAIALPVSIIGIPDGQN